MAVEGLDGSGKTRILDDLERWLERRGRIVQRAGGTSSRLLHRATRGPSGPRPVSERVAALLVAADAVRSADRSIRPAIARGEIVLADRYAWSAVARLVARGVDATWAARLFAAVPRPDLVIHLELDPDAAVERSLSIRPASVRDDAIAQGYDRFVRTVAAALSELARGAAVATAAPWPVRLLSHDATAAPEVTAKAIRATLRAMIDVDRLQGGEPA